MKINVIGRRDLAEVITEHETNIHDLYPKKDKYINVHFESPFRAGDVVQFKDEITKEYLYWGCTNKVCESAFINDTKHALTFKFIINDIYVMSDEHGNAEAYAGFCTAVDCEGIKPWIRDINMKYLKPAKGYTAHSFSFDTKFPYKTGIVYYNRLDHDSDTLFGIERNKIEKYKYIERGTLHVNNDFHVSSQCFNIRILHMDMSLSREPEFKFNGWDGYIFGYSYSARRSKKTGDYTKTLHRSIYPVEELREHITPDMYHNYIVEDFTSSYDVKRLQFILNDLGYDYMGDKYQEFKRIADENMPTEDDTKKCSVTKKKSTSKKKKEQTEVEKIISNMTEEQKAEMFKLLSK